MKAISTFLLFMTLGCMMAQAQVPWLDRKKLNKEHGNKHFLDWPLTDLPFTAKNQKPVFDVITLCFEDIQKSLPLDLRGISQLAVDDVRFSAGRSDLHNTLWYFSFGTDLISDYWVVYVYSLKEKKLIGKFAPGNN